MIHAHNLHKSYREGDKTVSVLKGIDFKVRPGMAVGIVGASGAGKSTLLHLLGGLDAPTQGRVEVEGEDLYALSEGKRSRLRNLFFGFVFQFYHLLPELTALENVMLPSLIARFSRSQAKEQAMEGLLRVGLESRASHFPSELSGGEQQRVAVARACVLKPKLVLADEPTGNLDSESGREVLEMLLEVARLSKGSLVLVTHNKDLTKNLDAVSELKDGQLHQI